MGKSKVELEREETRPCACGRGTYTIRTFTWEMRALGDEPGWLEEWRMDCPRCRRVFHPTANQYGDGFYWVRRIDYAASLKAERALDAALNRLHRLASRRYLKKWLALFDGVSQEDLRRRLPEKWSRGAVARSIKTAIGGRHGFLKAQFTPSNLPVILKQLKVSDPQIRAAQAALARAEKEERKAEARLKRRAFR